MSPTKREHPRATAEPAPRRGDRVARALTIALAAALALVAALSFAASFLAYGTVKRRLDRFASDGDADLTRAEFDAAALRVRVAACVLLLVAVAVVLARRRIARCLVTVACSARASSLALVHGLRRWVAGESRLHLVGLGLVTIAAAVVRIEFLFQPMRYDESVTFVHYASQPWYVAVTTYTAPNNHVFHSILVHLSTGVLGNAPWAIRMPAFLAGVFLVPATYAAGRALYGRYVALVGAALVAGSSVLVEYSTNARGYTIVALAFTLLLALATRLASTASPAEWIAFAAIGALGLFTVPIMLYGLGGVALWLLVTMWGTPARPLVARRLLPAVTGAVVLGGLLYAPIVASSGLGALTANDFVEPLSWGAFAADLPDSLDSTLRGWGRDVPVPVEALAIGGIVVAVVLHRRISRFTWPPLAVVVAWIVPVVLLQRVAPFERVWLFLLPLVLVTSAAGLVWATRRVVRARLDPIVSAAAVVLAIGLSAIAVATQSVAESEDTSTFRDAQSVANLLVDQLRPGDKVLVAPPADAILEYELDVRGLDPSTLLYWDRLEGPERLLAVIKTAPGNYGLEYLREDPRVARRALGPARLIGGFAEARVYELQAPPR